VPWRSHLTIGFFFPSASALQWILAGDPNSSFVLTGFGKNFNLPKIKKEMHLKKLSTEKIPNQYF
jgi:hypothetical protein